MKAGYNENISIFVKRITSYASLTSPASRSVPFIAKCVLPLNMYVTL